MKFVNGEIKVFGQYFEDFCFTKRKTGGNPLPEFRINVYTNYLESKKEVLQWYVDMNAGGTPHTNNDSKTWINVKFYCVGAFA